MLAAQKSFEISNQTNFEASLIKSLQCVQISVELQLLLTILRYSLRLLVYQRNKLK